jgi:hypothetical protein
MSQPPPPPNMPPPPPGYGYGVQPQRGGLPSGVNVASILFFVVGGLSVLGGLILLLASTFTTAGHTIGAVALIVGLVEIWVGVALRQLKQWARLVGLVLACLGAILQLIGLIAGGYTGVVGLVLNVVIIYMLMRPDSRQAFETSGR